MTKSYSDCLQKIAAIPTSFDVFTARRDPLGVLLELDLIKVGSCFSVCRFIVRCPSVRPSIYSGSRSSQLFNNKPERNISEKFRSLRSTSQGQFSEYFINLSTKLHKQSLRQSIIPRNHEPKGAPFGKAPSEIRSRPRPLHKVNQPPSPPNKNNALRPAIHECPLYDTTLPPPSSKPPHHIRRLRDTLLPAPASARPICGDRPRLWALPNDSDTRQAQSRVQGCVPRPNETIPQLRSCRRAQGSIWRAQTMVGGGYPV